jgi:hypothetical protein
MAAVAELLVAATLVVAAVSAALLVESLARCQPFPVADFEQRQFSKAPTLPVEVSAN